MQVYVGEDVEEYDKIIVTSPLQYLPNFFDATEEEKQLFAKIDYERYDVTALTCKPGTYYPDMSGYLFDNMVPERLGHLMVFYHRWANEPNQVLTTYVLRNYKGKELKTYDEAKKMAWDDMKLCGIDIDKCVYERKWYYFPHVFEKDYADGLVRKSRSNARQSQHLLRRRNHELRRHGRNRAVFEGSCCPLLLKLR